MEQGSAAEVVVGVKPAFVVLAFQGPDLVEKPWKLGRGYLLTTALKHELGHVLGIGHVGSGVMSAGYMEMALKTVNAATYANDPDKSGFFDIYRDGVVREDCWGNDLSPDWLRFLGYAGKAHCFQYSRHGDKIDIRVGESMEDLVLAGTLTAERETFSWQEAIRVYLTPEQRVYDACPQAACQMPWALGPMIKNSERAGTYRSAGGATERQMWVTFSPLSVGDTLMKFGGVLDGKVVTNLEWYSPLK